MFWTVPYSMKEGVRDVYARCDPYLSPDTGMIISLHLLCPEVPNEDVEDVEEGFKTMVGEPFCSSLELVTTALERFDRING